jgi:hypothetical protein
MNEPRRSFGRSRPDLRAARSSYLDLRRPYNIAVIYAGLEEDEALARLNRAYDAPSYMHAVYLNTDAHLDSLHSDPALAN